MRSDGPDDEPRQPSRASFVPSEAWIDAFEDQCTDAMLKGVRRFAAYRARFLGWNGSSNDAYYAEELAQNAVTDTMLGVLRWDPSVQSLERHLLDAIRLRARRDRAHAERYPHASIDASDSDDESGVLAEAEASLLADRPDATAESTERAESAERAAATTANLRAGTADDPLAQRFLDAIEEGATSRSDIMRIAGLTSAEYHNTRRRLARLVAQLPRHLQPGRDILAEGT